MSKAKVLEHLGDAHYRIEQQRDITAVDARIEQLEEQIKKSNELINNKLQADVNAAQAALDAIDIHDEDALEQVMVVRHKLELAKQALANEKLTRSKALKEKGKLEEIEPSKIRTAWLADYNTDLQPGTVVGLLDWYQARRDNTSNRFLIIPAYINDTPECLYNPIRDGRLVPHRILSVYSWWYAIMICAGLERWNPRYRKGIITAMDDNGLCDVTVDDIYTKIVRSGYHPLNNREIFLKKVPVRYLSCDSAAFQVGDRVVLEYPLKDIHIRFLQQFDAAIADITKKLTQKQQEKTALQQEIDAQQAVIDATQAEIDQLLLQIKTTSDNNGISALQAEIAALQEEIATLSETINDQQKIRAESESDYKTYAALVERLQQELQELVDNNASEDQINSKIAEIADANQQQQDALDAYSAANSALSTALTAKNDKSALLNDKRDQLQPLLHLLDHDQQQVKVFLDLIALQEVDARKLKEQKTRIALVITSLELDKKHAENALAHEQGKSEKLETYTKNRPKEIMIVGFESNPRPCNPIYCVTVDYENLPPDLLPGGIVNLSAIPVLIYKTFKKQESKYNHYTGRIYSTGYHSDTDYNSRYWINSKGTKAVSWDSDSIYYKGRGFTVINYSDSSPHNAPHDIVICAAFNETTITNSDYIKYKLVINNLTNEVIGAKRFVVITDVNNDNSFKLTLWAWLPTPIKCYERDLTELNSKISGAFTFMPSFVNGFLGDGLSLIFNLKKWDNSGNGNATGDGLFKCLFSSDYTEESFITLSEDVYTVVNRTSSMSFHQEDTEYGPVTVGSASISESLVSNGLDIQQIYIHQDSVTVIMRSKEIHSWDHAYSTDINLNKTITNDYNAVSEFRPFRLKGNSLVDTGIILFRHKEIFSETANDAYDYYNQVSSSPYYDVDACCLFANADKGLYIYRTDVQSWNNALVGTTKTVDYHEVVKIIIKHKGKENIIHERVFSNSYTEQTSSPIVTVENYANESRAYAEEWNFLDIRNNSYCFDNSLLICCFNAGWQSGNYDDKTLIYNVKNQQEKKLLDYRIDNYNNPGFTNNAIFTLSVTS